MVRTLRIFVILSMIASILTLFTAKWGVGELYPFTSWKLFTQPVGSGEVYATPMLYGATTRGWQLLPLKEGKHLDFDDAYYLLHDLSSTALTDTSSHHKRQLRSFAQELYPSTLTYQLRERTYVLAKDIQDTLAFTEKIICTF